ncbi:hypothetical protein GCM10027592_45790 [Spirosoma flavus]
MKYILTFLIVLFNILYSSSQDKNFHIFIQSLKQNARHQPTKLKEHLFFPFSFLGKINLKTNRKDIDQFILSNYIRKNLAQIPTNEIIEYESKLEHPFYGSPTYMNCFSYIPSNQRVYEIDIENEHGRGPAYFFLIASKNNKFYVFTIAN